MDFHLPVSGYNNATYDDSMLDFDITEFDFNAESETSTMSSGSPTVDTNLIEAIQSPGEPELIKSTSVAKRSTRYMKKRVAPKEVKEPRTKWAKGTIANLSRRQHNMDLYAFPHFDKCDSLLYFTSAFSRHRNSGDYVATFKLLSAHLDPQCKITYTEKCAGLTIRALMKVFRVLDEVMPDAIMCVYETKVVGNQIFSSAHAKFTDSQQVFDSVALNNTDPMFDGFFKQRRDEVVLRKMAKQLRHRTDEETMKLMAIVEERKDVIIHKRMDFVLTFDAITKRVTEFQAKGTVTSVESTEGVHEQQKIC